jgi:hypothetical protein
MPCSYCGEPKENCGGMASMWSDLDHARRDVVQEREGRLIYLHDYVVRRARRGRRVKDVPMSEVERGVQARYARLAMRLRNSSAE